MIKVIDLLKEGERLLARAEIMKRTSLLLYCEYKPQRDFSSRKG